MDSLKFLGALSLSAILMLTPVATGYCIGVGNDVWMALLFIDAFQAAIMAAYICVMLEDKNESK